MFAFPSAKYWTKKKTLERRLDTAHAFLVRIDDTQFYASVCLAACALRKLASSLRRVNGASNLVGATTALRSVRFYAPVHSQNFVSANNFPSQCFDLCSIDFHFIHCGFTSVSLYTYDLDSTSLFLNLIEIHVEIHIKFDEWFISKQRTFLTIRPFILSLSQL